MSIWNKNIIHRMSNTMDELLMINENIKTIFDKFITPTGCAIRVREGGGAENIHSSLALSVSRMGDEIQSLRTELAEVKAALSDIVEGNTQSVMALNAALLINYMSTMLCCGDCDDCELAACVKDRPITDVAINSIVADEEPLI